MWVRGLLVANANMADARACRPRGLAGLRAAQLRASGAAAEPVEPESEEEAAGTHVLLGARRGGASSEAPCAHGEAPSVVHIAFP